MADTSFANALNDAGAAVNDLFGSRGATASASSYKTAASIAEQNALLTQQATAIKETQASRQIFRTISAQRASVAGAGFDASGTALDLLRSSASEGALTKAMIAQNGAITENSYAEQSGIYNGMADAAKSSSTAQTIGGVIQGAGGALNLAKGASGLFNTGGAVTGVASAAEMAAAGVADATAYPIAGIVETAATEGLAVDAGVTAAAAEGADFLATAGPVAAAAWVICTELRQGGELSDALYQRGAQYVARIPKQVVAGYHFWAVPYTRLMRRSVLARRLIAPLALARARHIAGEWNLTGWLSVVAGERLCSAIGYFLKCAPDWKSLYAPEHR